MFQISFWISEVAKGKLHSIPRLEVSQLSKPRVSGQLSKPRVSGFGTYKDFTTHSEIKGSLSKITLHKQDRLCSGNVNMSDLPKSSAHCLELCQCSGLVNAAVTVINLNGLPLEKNN